MRSKSNMKNIILILTLNIVFLSSMWNCNDKFNEMCVKYPQLRQKLSEPKYDKNCITTTKIIPTDDVVKDIKKGLWALFEITLIDDIATKIDMDKKGNLLEGIVNEQFLILNLDNSFYFSLFREGDIPNNKVYLFVSDIRTCLGKKAESLFMKSDTIKEINVICSSNRRNSGDIRYLFSECKNLEKVNLENLKLNGLIVDRLFNQCNKLKAIKLQKFNGNKNSLFNLVNLLAGVKCDDSKRTVKLSCTEHFFSKIYMWDVKKVSWQDDKNEEKCFTIDYDWNVKHKKNLKNSDCYREFTLIFDGEEQEK